MNSCEDRLDPRTSPANWGEFLRIRGALHEQSARHSAAYHDFAQSANVFELLGERYQAALSQLALGRMAARSGNRSTAQRYLDLAAAVFNTLGAQRDLNEVGAARVLLEEVPAVAPAASPDADEAIIRRLIDAAIFPDLLARETATALLETTEADAAVVFVTIPGGDVRVVTSAGCDAAVARALARAASTGTRGYGRGCC